MVKNLNAGLTKNFTVMDNPELDALLNEIIRRLNEVTGNLNVKDTTDKLSFFTKPSSVTPGAGSNPNPGSKQALTDNMGNLVYDSTFTNITTNGV